jgi:hypothetical protein
LTAGKQPPAVPEPIESALAMMRQIFESKNADYASGDWKSNFIDVASQMNFDSPGVACDTLIAVKQARLKSLTYNGRTPANEAVFDTYLDRAVYSLIRLAIAIEAGE